MENETQQIFNIKEFSNIMRSDIKAIALQIKESKELAKEGDKSSDFGEVMANLTLAYRHLEDARMRMGKVIEAHEGYNKFDVAAEQEVKADDA